LVAVGILGVNAWQSWETRKSAGAAKSAAEKANEGNRINRETLVSVQRAFISYNGIDPMIPPLGTMNSADKTPKTIGFKIALENHGSTRAKNVRMYGSYTDLPTEASIEKFRFPPPLTNELVPVVFGPKENHSTTPLTVNFESLRSTEHRFVFWGWVTYNDIFENTPKHLTEFCRILNAFSFSKSKVEVRADFRTCPRYNCTDDECANYAEIVKLAESMKMKE
jgi:hypothetical protein